MRRSAFGRLRAAMHPRYQFSARCAVAAALLAVGSGCRSVVPEAPAARPLPQEVRDLRRTIDELYAAFCFDPRAEPDWETQRRIYLAGAVFVPPIRAGRAPRIDDTETFLSDFRSYATSDPYRSTGFHERIVGTHLDVFGGVASAFVAFEGFTPRDGETMTRGLDSIQFVHDGTAWRLVSFATQYETAELSLPARFVGARPVD